MEPGHRVVSETVRARIHAEPDMREACDVKADDFDSTSIYICVRPEEKDVMRVSVFAPFFGEVHEAVGARYFEELFAPYGVMEAAPQPGYQITYMFALEQLPQEAAARGEHRHRACKIRPSLLSSVGLHEASERTAKGPLRPRPRLRFHSRFHLFWVPPALQTNSSRRSRPSSVMSWAPRCGSRSKPCSVASSLLAHTMSSPSGRRRQCTLCPRMTSSSSCTPSRLRTTWKRRSPRLSSRRSPSRAASRAT